MITRERVFETWVTWMLAHRWAWLVGVLVTTAVMTAYTVQLPDHHHPARPAAERDAGHSEGGGEIRRERLGACNLIVESLLLTRLDVPLARPLIAEARHLDGCSRHRSAGVLRFE